MVRTMISRKKLSLFFKKEIRLKKAMFLLPLFMYAITHAVEKNVMLESSVIRLADGTLINADKIEFIRKFRRTLLSFLLGDQLANGQRKGKYFFDGKWHNIESLARIEQELVSSNS